MRQIAVKGGLYDSQVSPKIRIPEKGERGVITIPQTHGLLTLWYEDTRMLVLKEKGHREYYNQYNPPFKVPTQFHVFMKIRAEKEDALLEVGVFPLNKEITPDEIRKEV